MNHRARHPRPIALVAAAGLLALSGCGGGGASDSAETSGDPDSAARESPAARAMADSADGGAAGSAALDTASVKNAQEPPAAQTQLVIRTGEVALVAKDLNLALDEVERLVGRHGGFLAQERTVNDRKGRTTRTTVELRVPSEDFRTVIDALEEVGDVQRASTEEEDVTTEVIDVESRIRTQEVSLSRLRGFLGRATNVSAMIRLESEIARREADLASMRAQQDYLADQTSLSTIRLTMSSPQAPRTTEEDPLDDAGFFAGLSNGWRAMVEVLLVVATVLGALVPFAVLLALLGAPLVLWLRWSRRRRPGPPTAPEAAA